jgi:hypothetical protein
MHLGDPDAWAQTLPGASDRRVITASSTTKTAIYCVSSPRKAHPAASPEDVAAKLQAPLRLADAAGRSGNRANNVFIPLIQVPIDGFGWRAR